MIPSALFQVVVVRFLALRYFNEVARLGSIRKAADRFHVAPSAISRQIAQLEHEVGTLLFQPELRYPMKVRKQPRFTELYERIWAELGVATAA